jgi:putative ABC transport system permease protein
MSLSLRYAIKDMRGALSSLYLVLMCLILGVGSIATVQFTSHAVLEGIQKNGRTILGGDLVIRNIYEPAPQNLRDWLSTRQGDLIETIEARVMLANAQTRDNALVELKVVPEGYPQYGSVEVESRLSLENGLKDNGILIDPALRGRLNLDVGDEVRLGDAIFIVKGFIAHEPDRAGGSRFGLAPRAMIGRTNADSTNLLNKGSMVYYDLRVKLPSGTSLKLFTNELETAFPEAPWKITDADNASPQITRFVERLMLFLTLVGLTALLIGGIGIGNGVRAHLEARLKTIAILKSLGASKVFIEKLYLWQIAIITLAGSVGGIFIGIILQYIAAPQISKFLPFIVEPQITAAAVMTPMIFGFLTSFAFALWPLGQAMSTSPLELFRAVIAPVSGKPSKKFQLGTLSAASVLAGLAVSSAHDAKFALWFVISAIACLFMFWLVGLLISKIAGKIPAPRHPALRLGLRNLHRPGNATSNTLISLGLGLTVMISITLIEMNLRQGIANNLPDDAPAFFFLDIQKDQKDAFEKLLSEQPTVHTIRMSPNLRGKIVSINGVPAEQALVDKSESWLLQNDRGFTYETVLPAHSEITSGEWWPADYKGTPLISVVEDVERGFGVKPGDQITVNILGRDITATIANTRSVNWMNMTINFAITFAPGTLEAAPHSWLATVVAEPEQEAHIQRMIGAEFPNISMIRLSDAVDAIGSVLGNIATAVRITALVAVATGILVLAGSLAASRMQRLYDVVILKVLGIKNRTLVEGFLFEFCLLGLCAGLLSMLLGLAVSWAVMVTMMELQWSFYPIPALITALGGIGLTMMIGWLSTGRVLYTPVAEHLRSDA